MMNLEAGQKNSMRHLRNQTHDTEQLIERVEVGRKYQVTIKLNMEYQQFLEITEEQKLIPLISA